MNLSDVMQFIVTPGLSLLPGRMTSPGAVAMLLAIGLQESRFVHRRQIGGPARGFYQFEHGGGVVGVLQHRQTSQLIQGILDRLQYDHSSATSYTAIEHNDLLATVYARLLLWTIPHSLPKQEEYDRSWDQYIEAWRPGRPHRSTWNEFYRQAWATVLEDTE
jgi:hypothetical protein